jgi:hypothetical protein
MCDVCNMAGLVRISVKAFEIESVKYSLIVAGMGG